MISEQDEHVRHILDRKGKIEDLKAMTLDKIKKYSHSRSLKPVSKPKTATGNLGSQPGTGVKQTTKYERTVQRTTYKHY